LEKDWPTLSRRHTYYQALSQNKAKKLNVRLRARQVLCHNCKNVCNEKGENVQNARRNRWKVQPQMTPEERRENIRRINFAKRCTLAPTLTRLKVSEIQKYLNCDPLKTNILAPLMPSVILTPLNAEEKKLINNYNEDVENVSPWSNPPPRVPTEIPIIKTEPLRIKLCKNIDIYKNNLNTTAIKNEDPMPVADSSSKIQEEIPSSTIQDETEEEDEISGATEEEDETLLPEEDETLLPMEEEDETSLNMEEEDKSRGEMEEIPATLEEEEEDQEPSTSAGDVLEEREDQEPSTSARDVLDEEEDDPEPSSTSEVLDELGPSLDVVAEPETRSLRKKRSAVGSMEDLWDETIFGEDGGFGGSSSGAEHDGESSEALKTAATYSAAATQILKISFGGEGTVLKIPAKYRLGPEESEGNMPPGGSGSSATTKAAKKALKRAQKEASKRLQRNGSVSPAATNFNHHSSGFSPLRSPRNSPRIVPSASNSPAYTFSASTPGNSGTLKIKRTKHHKKKKHKKSKPDSHESPSR